jgi:hypothetical protein
VAVGDDVDSSSIAVGAFGVLEWSIGTFTPVEFSVGQRLAGWLTAYRSAYLPAWLIAPIDLPRE